MINLLEKFFEMKKPQCRETIEFYRRFLTRQEGVQVFLQLAEVRTYICSSHCVITAYNFSHSKLESTSKPT